MASWLCRPAAYRIGRPAVSRRSSWPMAAAAWSCVPVCGDARGPAPLQVLVPHRPGRSPVSPTTPPGPGSPQPGITATRNWPSRSRPSTQGPGGRYGVPRIHAGLRSKGHRHSRKRIARLIRQAGLAGRAPRRWKKTTIPDPAAMARADANRRDFTADAARVNTRVVRGRYLHRDLGRVAVPISYVESSRRDERDLSPVVRRLTLTQRPQRADTSTVSGHLPLPRCCFESGPARGSFGDHRCAAERTRTTATSQIPQYGPPSSTSPPPRRRVRARRSSSHLVSPWRTRSPQRARRGDLPFQSRRQYTSAAFSALAEDCQVALSVGT